MVKNDPQNNSYYRVKPIFEKVLGALFGSLAVFHLLYTMSIYVMGSKYQPIALKADRYMALIALLALAAYVVLMVTQYRLYAKSTIVSYIRQIFSGGNLWLTVLFIWYLIGCIVLCARIGGKIFTMNDRLLLDVVISFFVLYMFPWNRKTYDWFIHILMLVETVFMVWVLYNTFKLNILKVPGGQIGMSKGYSLTIACNSNTTGAFAAAFLMLALYMISAQEGIVRVAYVVAALIQLFPLYLSNSRTAYLACVIAVAAAGFFLVYRKYTGKHKVVLALGCGLLCGAALYFLRYAVFTLFDGVTHLSEQQNSDGIRDVDLSNASGRIPIWKAAVKGMFLSSEIFMVGATPARVEAVLGYVLNKENFMMYTHNQFLQIGVAFGIPGLIFYCIWLLKTAKQCWKVAFHGRYWVIACMVLMLVMANLTESYLVAYFYFCGSVFFLVCGMIRSEAAELCASNETRPQKPTRKKEAPSNKKNKKNK
ncbi:MAG: O-antigen ligase family protein [Deltaproteobacteria bacterium]|nr:O-antigen ligase family protein [Deltaproteobacteria bacterium]